MSMRPHGVNRNKCFKSEDFLRKDFLRLEIRNLLREVVICEDQVAR